MLMDENNGSSCSGTTLGWQEDNNPNTKPDLSPTTIGRTWPDPELCCIRLFVQIFVWYLQSHVRYIQQKSCNSHERADQEVSATKCCIVVQTCHTIFPIMILHIFFFSLFFQPRTARWRRWSFSIQSSLAQVSVSSCVYGVTTVESWLQRNYFVFAGWNCQQAQCVNLVITSVGSFANISF